MKKIVIVLLVIIIGIGLIFASCTTSPTSVANVINIGEIEPLTGGFSDVFKYLPEGAQLAADYVNNHGGITIDGQKYTINLILQDSKSTVDGAASAATDLILDRNVKFIVGTGVTFLIIPIQQVCEQYGVLYVAAGNNGHPDEMGPSHPLKFSGNNCCFSVQYAALQYIKKAHPEVKTLALIKTDDGTIQYNDIVIRKFAQQLGLTFVGDTVGIILPATTDFTPIAQKALALKTDAIMMNNSGAALGQLLQNFHGANYSGVVYDSNFDTMSDVLEFAGKENAEGFLCAGTPSDPNIPSLAPIAKEIIQAAIDEYGQFKQLHYTGFEGVYGLAQAIQKAQSLDPEVVAATWDKMTDIDTMYGPGKMSGLQTYGVNHSMCSPVPVQQVVNGQIKLITWIPVEEAMMP